MPYYIRRLPTQSKGTMVDPKSLPGNLAFFNPSRAGDITYIRVTEHEASGVTQRNKIFLFDNEKKEQHMIPSPWDQLVKTGNMFQGIEDLRITWFEDRLWFAGTTTHASQEMTNELIVGHFNKRLTEVEFLSTVDIGHLPVKNVCPFVWKGKLCLWDTFKRRIYEIYKEEQHPKKLFAKTIQTFEFGPGLPTTELRGSTSPIHLHGNTWGCVVHDIIFNDTPMVTFRLSYIHHWLEFDIERGQITFISQPFFIAIGALNTSVASIKTPKTVKKLRCILVWRTVKLLNARHVSMN